MLAIDGSLLDFKKLDLLALQESALHQLDPRAKVITTLLFILCVVSFDRYTISGMIPFLVYPVTLLILGDLPVVYLLRKLLIVLPFAVIIGIFNPVFDRQVILQFGSIEIWGGWVSCASIVMRAVLTASAALILVAITGFPNICEALQKLGMPKVFAMQLQFLYRYIFVLTDEAVRVARARQLRSFGKKGLGLSQFGSLVGNMLLRTWERAERVHMAMLARGFNGQIHVVRTKSHIGRAELLFMGSWISLFILLRLYNVTLLVGWILIGTTP